MKKRNRFFIQGQKGSLLIETFIALMILSVGITSLLHVFQGALFTNQHLARLAEAERGMELVAFDWFAYPENTALPEAGQGRVPLLTPHLLPGGNKETAKSVEQTASGYWVEIRPRPLLYPVAEADTVAKAQVQQSPYYETDFLVNDSRNETIFSIKAMMRYSKVKKDEPPNSR